MTTIAAISERLGRRTMSPRETNLDDMLRAFLEAESERRRQHITIEALHEKVDTVAMGQATSLHWQHEHQKKDDMMADALTAIREEMRVTHVEFRTRLERLEGDLISVEDRVEDTGVHRIQELTKALDDAKIRLAEKRKLARANRTWLSRTWVKWSLGLLALVAASLMHLLERLFRR